MAYVVHKIHVSSGGIEIGGCKVGGTFVYGSCCRTDRTVHVRRQTSPHKSGNLHGSTQEVCISSWITSLPNFVSPSHPDPEYSPHGCYNLVPLQTQPPVCEIESVTPLNAQHCEQGYPTLTAYSIHAAIRGYKV